MNNTETYVILDWMSNICFYGQEFDSFDDAEEFLTERLGETYEEERDEYEIVLKDR